MSTRDTKATPVSDARGSAPADARGSAPAHARGSAPADARGSAPADARAATPDTRDGRLRWTIPLVRIAGIPVRAHATILLLLAWWLIPTWLRVLQGGEALLDEAMREIVVVVALFASIVLHELGHAVVARRYGVRTIDIVLLPIGGVARLDKLPKAPRAELAIALAGPAVSFVIAVVAFAVTLFLAGASLKLRAVFAGTPIVAAIAWMNLMLCAFNLLPAFPMDGGRALRALLAIRMSHSRATVVAARVG